LPELPEVETIVRGLRPHLEGRRVVRVAGSRLLRALPSRRGVLRALAGRRLVRLWRRGKYLLADLDDGRALLVHLGMSGQLVLEPAGAAPRRHLHLALRLAGLSAELRFYDPRRFGRVAVGGLDELCSWTGLGGLGIEPLDSSAEQLGAAIRARGKALKALLLEQGAVAGLGNIYADEALFRSGLHPARRASALSAAEGLRLGGAIREVLAEAVAGGGSTIGDYVRHDGTAGSFQHRHLVYGRGGQACPHCGGRIAVRLLAGRSTHFCPRCQPAAGRSGVRPS
jgi:formamidopyrimidine-DNA glycosylase